MSPPPAFTHADRQGQIADLLKSLLPGGRALPECPLSTADGIKAVDVVWLAPGGPELVNRPIVLTTAPEICVEVLSPSNTTAEIDEKRASTSTRAPQRSGSATSTALCPSFLALIIGFLLPLFVRTFLERIP